MDTFKQDQLHRDFVSFADSMPQKASRPLKADGAAGIIAMRLLLGSRLSVQDAVRVLEADGKVSNDTARRMREAIRWIERNGAIVSKQLLTRPNGIEYHQWYVSAGDTMKLYNMIKGTN